MNVAPERLESAMIFEVNCIFFPPNRYLKPTDDNKCYRDKLVQIWFSQATISDSMLLSHPEAVSRSLGTIKLRSGTYSAKPKQRLLSQEPVCLENSAFLKSVARQTVLGNDLAMMRAPKCNQAAIWCILEPVFKISFDPVEPLRATIMKKPPFLLLSATLAICFNQAFAANQTSLGPSNSKPLNRQMESLSLSYAKNGYLQLDSQDARSAIESFTKSIRFDQSQSNAYAGRGMAFDELGDHKDAVSDFTKAIQLSPHDSTSYRSRGHAKESMNDFKGAIEDYSQAIKLNPGDDFAYTFRGALENQLNQYQLAISDLTKGIGLNPSANKYLLRGRIYLDRNRPQDAIQDFNQALLLNPDEALALRLRGQANASLKNYKGAIDDFTHSIALKPDSSDAYYDRASSKFDIADFAGAIDDYSQSISLNERNPLAYNMRGLLYERTKRHQDAVSDWEKYINLRPNEAVGYEHRGANLSDLGRYKEAIADCTKAIGLDRNSADSYSTRGSAYIQSGNARSAVNDFTQALKLYTAKSDPFNALFALTNRAETLCSLGDLQNSIEDFRQCVVLANSPALSKFAPIFAECAYRALASAELKHGLVKDALTNCNEALRLDSKSYFGYELRAKIKQKMGDEHGAQADLVLCERFKPAESKATPPGIEQSALPPVAPTRLASIEPKMPNVAQANQQAEIRPISTTQSTTAPSNSAPVIASHLVVENSVWTPQNFSLSLENHLDIPVANVHYIVIVLDRNNQPIDSKDFVCNEVIQPGLAKRQTCSVSSLFDAGTHASVKVIDYSTDPRQISGVRNGTSY